MRTIDDRFRGVRWTASAIAVLAAVPYLTLKVIWLGGGRLGLRSLESSPALDAINAATAGMGLVAVLLAAAFAFRWGRRVPAPLVLVPMWVGIGLLGVVAVSLPVVAIVSQLSGRQLLDDGPEMIVAPWVYGVVYVGFAVQAVALIVAFGLYAFQRWPAALRGRIGQTGGGTVPQVRAVLEPLTTGTAVATAGLVVLYLAWGLGATFGLSHGSLEGRDAAARSIDMVHAGFLAAAVFGLLVLVRGWGSSLPLWVATTLAWVGTGAMFAWGMWTSVLLATGGAGLGTPSGVGLLGLVGLMRFAVGIAMAIALLLALAGRRATANADRDPPTPSPRQLAVRDRPPGAAGSARLWPVSQASGASTLNGPRCGTGDVGHPQRRQA